MIFVMARRNFCNVIVGAGTLDSPLFNLVLFIVWASLSVTGISRCAFINATPLYCTNKL